MVGIKKADEDLGPQQVHYVPSSSTREGEKQVNEQGKRRSSQGRLPLTARLSRTRTGSTTKLATSCCTSSLLSTDGKPRSFRTPEAHLP